MVCSAADLLDYAQYWENQIRELHSKMKTAGSANLAGIREEINLFTKIRATIEGIVNILGDMNALIAGAAQRLRFRSADSRSPCAAGGIAGPQTRQP